MFITTKIIVGKLGYHQLAAVGIAGDLSFEILVILMGFLSVIGVLAAHADGAGDKPGLGQTVRQGFIVSTFLGIPSMILIWNLDLLLEATGQDPIVIALATPYLHGLSSMALPVLWFAVFRNFISALSKPAAVMVISVAAVFLNYLLTIWFVYGGFGLPTMGLFGAGLATAIVTWLMFFSLIIYIYCHTELRGYGLFQGKWYFDRTITSEIIRLGIPVAGLTFMEAGMFIAVAILSGVIGAKTLAAYEVVMSWVGIPFVMAFGLAEATMIRVAQAVGKNEIAAARRAGNLGMILGVAFLSVLVIVPLGFSDQIIRLFISPNDAGFEAVSVLAAQFLMIAAIFQVFDGLQAIAARALRAFKDMIAPLWIAGFGYWVLGICGGSLLAFRFDLQGAGLWWGLAIGLMTTSTLLCLRFNKLTQEKISLIEIAAKV
ncbi:MAG: MATE family multidrug resistance protein [Gammaproteobacteria bacterium]|jgi:MATE family multidrug resistance protein